MATSEHEKDSTNCHKTSDARRQRNKHAQALFRNRRRDYIAKLEATVKNNESTIATLQKSHHSSQNDCLLLRYKNSLLERIILEHNIDLNAKLRAKDIMFSKSEQQCVTGTGDFRVAKVLASHHSSQRIQRTMTDDQSCSTAPEAGRLDEFRNQNSSSVTELLCQTPMLTPPYYSVPQSGASKAVQAPSSCSRWPEYNQTQLLYTDMDAQGPSNKIQQVYPPLPTSAPLQLQLPDEQPSYQIDRDLDQWLSQSKNQVNENFGEDNPSPLLGSYETSYAYDGMALLDSIYQFEPQSQMGVSRRHPDSLASFCNAGAQHELQY